MIFDPSTSTTTRELAQRMSGTDEILLLWHPESDRVEVSVCDVETGACFQLEVAPDSANDAFYHPYAYAASRGYADGEFGSLAAIDNV